MSRWTGLTVCVVGYGRRSGKTRVIEELTKMLTSRGYSVATVKHCSHPIDVTGKDTWRHRAAGAKATLAVYKDEAALFLAGLEVDLDRYLDLLPSTSFTLIEGFRRLNYPKILCVTDRIGEDSIGDVGNLIAVVVCSSDVRIDSIGKPVFYLGNLTPLADILVDMALDRVERLLGGLNCGRCGFRDCRSLASAILKGVANPHLCTLSRGSKVEVILDGESIQLNTFTEKVIFSTIKALLSCLKGLEKLDRSDVRFKVEVYSA